MICGRNRVLKFAIYSRSSRHNISPLEVKSGKNYTLSSLSKFRRKYAEVLNIPYVIHTSDYMKEDGIIYLPVYVTYLL